MLACASVGCAVAAPTPFDEGIVALEHEGGPRTECMYGVCEELVPLGPFVSQAPHGAAVWFGAITGAYEARLNGELVTSEGSFEPLVELNTAATVIVLPPALVRGDGTDILSVRYADTWFGQLSHADWVIGEAHAVERLRARRAQSDGTWLAALLALHLTLAAMALLLATISRRWSNAVLVPMFCIFGFWKAYEHPAAAEWEILNSVGYATYLLATFPAIALIAWFTFLHSGGVDRRWYLAVGVWASIAFVASWIHHDLANSMVYVSCQISSVFVLGCVAVRTFARRRVSQDANTLLFGLGLAVATLILDPQVLGGDAGMSWQRHMFDVISMLFLGCLMTLSARTYRRDQQRLQNISYELLAASEMVRHEMAQELHDGVAQELVAMRLAILALGTDDAVAVAAQMDETLTEVRTLSHALARPTERSTAERVTRHVEALAKTATAELALTCESHLGPLCDEESHHMLRLVQEAVGNALKHGAPELVRVSLRYHKECVYLEVTDDGAGMSSDGRGGLGLESMRRRARSLGGPLEIETGAAGTSLRVAFTPKALRGTQ